jgi:ribonuclease HII
LNTRTDSKQLKEGERDDLFDVIKANNDFIGWNVHILTPQDISGGMLGRCAASIRERP